MEDQHYAVRATMHSSHKNKIRQLAHSARAETSAAVAQVSALHTQQLEDLKQKHAAALAEAEQAAQKRTADGKQFTYAVRGSSEPHLRGSVAHSIFDAEPGSILAQMYNGEWDYPQDKKGRALVNSNPAHWLQILDWLSFGIVPANPSPELVQQCRFWQLANLLAIIDPPAAAADPLADTFTLSKADSYDLTVRSDSQGCKARFVVDGHLHNFCERQWDNSEDDDIRIEAFGRCWMLSMSSYLMRMRPEVASDPRESVPSACRRDEILLCLSYKTVSLGLMRTRHMGLGVCLTSSSIHHASMHEAVSSCPSRSHSYEDMMLATCTGLTGSDSWTIHLAGLPCILLGLHQA